MTSVLVVVGIEMFFATRGAGHIHGSDYGKVSDENSEHGQHENGTISPKPRRPSVLRRFSQGPIGNHERTTDNGLRLGSVGGTTEQQVWSKVASSPLPPDVHTASPLASSDSDSDHDTDLDLDELDPDTASDNADLLQSDDHHQPPRSSLSHSRQPSSSSVLTPQATERKLLLQCLLLEAGILFHSVFIGIAVSVSTGPPFVVLLIAISFHQTFEGLALGSRIAAIKTLHPRSPKPWLMALAYGTTTPIGQAIGLAVHGLYDPRGQMGLLMVGSMNAISSGLLLFAGLVELLAEDFLSDGSYKTLRGRRRFEACGAVVGGAFLMALVGAWA